MINKRNLRRKSAGLAGCIAFGLHFAAAAQTANDDQTFSCSFGEGLRLINVKYPEANSNTGCEVIYEKRSEGLAPRVIWSAKNDMNFCAKKIKSTVDKLAAGGWTCEASGPGATTTSAIQTPRIEVAASKPSTPTVSEPAPPKAPELDRVLPEKATPPKTANVTPADKPAPAEPVLVAIPQKTTESTPSVLPLKEQPASTANGDYDDWIFRWDGSRKKLVFTLYNTQDGRKARSFAWAHDNLSSDAPSPTNIVLAKDESANQVLIIAWPGKESQYITVLNPLIREQPICEIETKSKADSGWGYEVTGNKLFLTGLKSSKEQQGKLIEFRQPCQS